VADRIYATPHLNKITAALKNTKATHDREVLGAARDLYVEWIDKMESLSSVGRARVDEMVALLNSYKDTLEVDLIMRRGSVFLRRQRGQLKLDNSVIEEFLIRLVDPSILAGIENLTFVTGPQKAFMSLAFVPTNFATLGHRPSVVLKSKDQDFVLGARLHYSFSPSQQFEPSDTASGSLILATLAAECKVNLDKTMFQEAAGTAARLKQGCPIAKYFLLVEHLDMQPEDTRLTEIDNVFILRRTKRLPANRRDDADAVERQHKDHPIHPDVVWMFVEQMQTIVSTAYFDPTAAIQRGSFV